MKFKLAACAVIGINNNAINSELLIFLLFCIVIDNKPIKETININKYIPMLSPVFGLIGITLLDSLPSSSTKIILNLTLLLTTLLSMLLTSVL